jgi:hypothetical protein
VLRQGGLQACCGAAHFRRRAAAGRLAGVLRRREVCRRAAALRTSASQRCSALAYLDRTRNAGIKVSDWRPAVTVCELCLNCGIKF